MSALQTELEYPSSDGKPLAESDVHINLLIDLRLRLREWFVDRNDVYVGSNMMVYHVEGAPRKSLAPDGFVVFGVPNHERPLFKTWQEGAFPSVVFEFTSRTTATDDIEKKFAIYQDVWRVKEYFLFDPTEDYLDPSLLGYRLTEGDFEPIPLVKGKLVSGELGITLERDGRNLNLRSTKTGKPLPIPMEKRAASAEKAAAKYQAELEQVKAELGPSRRSGRGEC